MVAVVTATVDPVTTSVTVQVSGATGPTGYVYREDQTGARASLTEDLITWNAGGFLGTDNEEPFDVPVRYVATTALNVDQAASPWVTVASDGASWLKAPGVPALNMPITVVSIDDRTRSKPQAVFNIIKRKFPVAVTSKRWAPVMPLKVLTETMDQYNDMVGILDQGSVLLLCTPGDSRYGNMYVDIGEVGEHSVTDLYGNPATLWTLPLTQTDRPAGIGSGSAGNEWSDVIATYATWADVIAHKPTWGDLVRRVAP